MPSSYGYQAAPILNVTAPPPPDPYWGEFGLPRPVASPVYVAPAPAPYVQPPPPPPPVVASPAFGGGAGPVEESCVWWPWLLGGLALGVGAALVTKKKKKKGAQ